MSSRDRDPSAGRDAPSPSLAADTASAAGLAVRSKTSPSPAPSVKLADPELPLPSPQQTNDANDDDDVPNEGQQRQSKPFEPLFTLVTNTTANTTAHPRVHYLFSDDDAASILAAHNPSSSSDRALLVDLARAPASSSPGDESAAPTAAAAAGGWAVSWAGSLSGDFAVTGAQLSVQQGDGGALMLQVDGVEREPVDLDPASSRSSGSGGSTAAVAREDVDVLLDDFRRRLGVMKKVVAEGEKRRRALLGEGQEGDGEHGQADHAGEAGPEALDNFEGH